MRTCSSPHCLKSYLCLFVSSWCGLAPEYRFDRLSDPPLWCLGWSAIGATLQLAHARLPL
jgi:hypothetical protein